MIYRTAANLTDVFADCAALRGLAVRTLTAWSAWETFADFAAVDVSAAGGPDSDALLYQWGTFGIPGRRQFHLVLSRQVAAPPLEVSIVGREEYLQFDCRLRYEPDPTLEALGRFESSWVQDGDTAVGSWISRISSRPEWQVLAPLTPVSVEVTTARV